MKNHWSVISKAIPFSYIDKIKGPLKALNVAMMLDCKGNITPLIQKIERFQRLQRQRSSRFRSGFVDNCETTYQLLWHLFQNLR